MTTSTTAIATAETDVTVQFGDWSPDDLRAMVAQEQELRSIIVEYYRSQMIEKKHYYILQGGQKPALSKEGALNLCSLFKVRVAADDPHEQHHDDGHYSVRYRVFLVNTRTGNGVADGDGYCSTRESKYAYRWVKPNHVPDGIDPATLAKRQGRYGTQLRLPNTDLADHYNTVLKMAYKRAIVAAALCLPLVSELFTQDIEEHATTGQKTTAQSPARSQREEPPAPQSAAPSSTTAPVQQVTEEDLKRLFRLIRQYQADEDAFRAYLTRLGLQSSKEMTPDQLADCLTEIETWKENAFSSHDESESDPDTSGLRAKLYEAIASLQVELAQAEQSQPPGESHAQALIDLAQWVPRVARDCENPNTPEAQLQCHLVEVTESIQNLRELTMDTAA